MPEYIPAGSVVWSGTGYGGRADFRFKVTSIYSYANNQTTLTIGLQARIVGDSSWLFYYGLQAGTISAGGTTLQDFSGTSYTIRPTSRNTWYDVGTSGTPKTWSKTVNHNADGSASVTLAATGINLYYYSGGAEYNIRLSGTYSASLDLSQTRTYTLSISKGTGSTITVTRGGVALANGASITYGDVLTVTFGASSGYTLATHTLNGSTFTSGNTHTVTGGVAVAATATATGYTLTISPGANSTLVVKKNGTPLSSGATVYVGDVLSISATAATGYSISAVTVNGEAIANNSNYTVGAANVTVASTATQNPPVVTDGGVWLYVNGAWAEYQAYIYVGGAWVKYHPYIYTSNGWVKY